MVALARAGVAGLIFQERSSGRDVFNTTATSLADVFKETSHG